MPIDKDLLGRIKEDSSNLIKLDFLGNTLTEEDLENLLSAIKDNNFIRQIEWGPQDKDNTPIMNTINGCLKKNVEKYEQQKEYCMEHAAEYHERPTDYEYAMLSEHVYEDVQVGSTVWWKRADGVQKELLDWKVHKVFKDTLNGYYSVAYIQEEKKFLVLAHRGSELNFFSLFYSDYAKDLNTDVDIIYNRITGQQVNAYAAAKEMVELAKKSKWSFSSTGHSLGGWLAQLTLIHCHKDFDYKEANVVTFDNPGAADMLKSLEKGALGGYKVREHELDAITYFVSPNLVNVNGNHLGNARELLPKIKNLNQKLDKLEQMVKEKLEYYLPKDLVAKGFVEWSSKRLFEKLSETEIVSWLQTVAQHAIDGIVDCFDPVSGFPIEQRVVEHWPSVVWHKENKMLEGLIKDSINALVSTATDVLIPSGIFGWAKKYTTQKITEETLKALKGSLDLQFVHTVDLFLNYYSGGADKENYVEFLKFANEKNNYMPKPVIIKEVYALHYKAQYKIEPYSEHVLSLKHFRPTIRSHLKTKSKEIDCVLYGSCDSKMVQLPKTIKFKDGQSDIFVDTSYLLNKNNAFWFRQYIACLDKVRLLDPLPIITEFSDWRQDLIEYYKRKLGVWRDVFDKRTLDIDDTYIRPSIFSLKGQEGPKKILFKDVITEPKPGHNVGQQKAFIVGKPGMGKTLFLKYIAYKWAKGELWQEFRWVFFIELRNLRKDNYRNLELNWLDVIAQEIFQKELTKEENNFLINFLEKDFRDGRILLLLDGYDEIVSEDDWDINPYVRKLFNTLLEHKPNYLLTSRLDIEKTSVRGKEGEFKYINRFEMGEFDVQESNAYIEKFFINDKRKADTLKAYLATNFFTNKNAFHLANIPLNLEILCALWENAELNKNIKPTLTELYDKLLERFMVREYAKYNSVFTYADVEDYFTKTVPALPVLSTMAYRMLENNNQIAMETAKISEMLNKELSLEGADIALCIERMQNLGFLKPHRADDDRDSVGHSQEFRHEMFRDFFAAKYITKLFKENTPLGVNILNKHKHTPHFEMSFIFTVGLLANHSKLSNFFDEFLIGGNVDLFGVRNRLMMIPYLEEIRENNLLKKNVIDWIFEILKTDQLDALENFASALENTCFINSYPAVIELILNQLVSNDIQHSINAITILNALKNNFQETRVNMQIAEKIAMLLNQPCFLHMRADKTINFLLSLMPILDHVVSKIKTESIIVTVKDSLIEISNDMDCNFFMRHFAKKVANLLTRSGIEMDTTCNVYEKPEEQYLEKLFDLHFHRKLMDLHDFIVLINNEDFEIKILTFRAIMWYRHYFNEDQLSALLNEAKTFLIREENLDENREVLYWCASAIFCLSTKISSSNTRELLVELKKLLKKEKYIKINIFIIDILGRIVMDENLRLSESEKTELSGIIYESFQQQTPEQCTFIDSTLYHPYSGGLILPAKISFEHLNKTNNPSQCYKRAILRYLCNALRDASTRQRDKYTISYHDNDQNRDFSFREWDGYVFDDTRLEIVQKIISESGCGYHTQRPREISKKPLSSTTSIGVEAVLLFNEAIEGDSLSTCPTYYEKELNSVLLTYPLEVRDNNQRIKKYESLTTIYDNLIYKKLELMYLKLKDRPLYMEADVREKFDLELSILQNIAFHLALHGVDSINNQTFLEIIKDNIGNKKSNQTLENMLNSLNALGFFEFSNNDLIKFSDQTFNSKTMKNFLAGGYYVNNLFLKLQSWFFNEIHSCNNLSLLKQTLIFSAGLLSKKNPFSLQLFFEELFDCSLFKEVNDCIQEIDSVEVLLYLLKDSEENWHKKMLKAFSLKQYEKEKLLANYADAIFSRRLEIDNGMLLEKVFKALKDSAYEKNGIFIIHALSKVLESEQFFGYRRDIVSAIYQYFQYLSNEKCHFKNNLFMNLKNIHLPVEESFNYLESNFYPSACYNKAIEIYLDAKLKINIGKNKAYEVSYNANGKKALLSYEKGDNSNVNSAQYKVIGNLYAHYLLSTNIAPINQKTNNILFDYGVWDSNIRHHPQTGEPVFSYYVYKDEKSVGSASFYKHPLICRSEDNTRHNVLELTGVLSQYNIDKKINEINEICEQLPPTSFEQTMDTISYAGQHGIIRGLSNTVRNACKKTGAPDWMAKMVRESVYCATFFIVRYTYYSNQLEREQTITESSVVPFSQAATDTGYLLLSNAIIEGAAYSAKIAYRNKWHWTGKMLGLFGHYAGYAKYAYDTCKQGLIQMGLGLAVGNITEQSVEMIANKIIGYNKLYEAGKAARKAEEAARKAEEAARKAEGAAGRAEKTVKDLIEKLERVTKEAEATAARWEAEERERARVEAEAAAARWEAKERERARVEAKAAATRREAEERERARVETEEQNGGLLYRFELRQRNQRGTRDTPTDQKVTGRGKVAGQAGMKVGEEESRRTRSSTLKRGYGGSSKGGKVSLKRARGS